jgi:hypothetical protein
MASPGSQPKALAHSQEPRKRVTIHTTRQTHDTIKPIVESISCIRLSGHSFPFGTSFLHPRAARLLKASFDRRKKTLKKYPKWKCTIFGHTDTEGDEKLNKDLSTRRAISLFAFSLGKDEGANLWEQIYQKEKWGKGIIRQILTALGSISTSDDDLKPFIRNAQNRKALFKSYMSDKAYTITPHKLETRYTEPPVIGCGEYNQICDHPSSTYRDKAVRRRANAVNRRVTIFFWSGKGPKFISKCNQSKCEGFKNKKILKGKQQFRCPFYWRHFRMNRCEAPVRRGLSRCAKLRRLYTYLRHGRGVKKKEYECTLLRILEKFVRWDGKRCAVPKGLDPTIMHPRVYAAFYRGLVAHKGGAFPYQDFPLFSIHESTGTMRRIKKELNARKIPREVRKGLDKWPKLRLTPKTPEIHVARVFPGGFWDRVLNMPAWYLTDRDKNQIFVIKEEFASDGYRDLGVNRLGYRTLIHRTTSLSELDAYKKSKICVVRGHKIEDPESGQYEKRAITTAQFFNRGANPKNRLNYVQDVLFKTIESHEEANKAGNFYPEAAAKYLTRGKGTMTWKDTWVGDEGIVSHIFYLEEHIDALERLRIRADVRPDKGAEYAVEYQFRAYYIDQILNAKSLYSCFLHGSRDKKNARATKGKLKFVENKCAKTGKCNPAECL